MTFKNKIMNNSSLFVNFVKNAVTASPKVQSNFLEISNKLAETVLKIVQDADLIINLNYKGKEFWNINKCKVACFVDGGVDKTSIISTAPLSIRAGSYAVKPNAHQKENFLMKVWYFK